MQSPSIHSVQCDYFYLNYGVVLLSAFPTLRIVVTLQNVTETQVNSSAIEDIGYLIATTLSQPLSHITFVRAQTGYTNITIVSNSTGGLPAFLGNNTRRVPTLGLTYVLMFLDDQAFSSVTPETIALVCTRLLCGCAFVL